MSAVVVIGDDAASVVTLGAGDGCDAAVSAVAEDDSVAVEQVRKGLALPVRCACCQDPGPTHPPLPNLRAARRS
ncbi:hypothetical protein [Mycobacterium simiae]|uniref:hypothetical protein n=1 Tax=Mycobacterium simiae TaxID=1784 RepID=UPI001CB6C62B|nr:hypothetical protein [Mycobacterium simiae]